MVPYGRYFSLCGRSCVTQPAADSAHQLVLTSFSSAFLSLFLHAIPLFFCDDGKIFPTILVLFVSPITLSLKSPWCIWLGISLFILFFIFYYSSQAPRITTNHFIQKKLRIVQKSDFVFV